MRVVCGMLLLFAAEGAVGQAAQRIVSTAPSITETLFALGLGPHVVGVSQYCEWPAEVAKLPRVGSYVQPNLEAIVRLRPDLARKYGIGIVPTAVAVDAGGTVTARLA